MTGTSEARAVKEAADVVVVAREVAQMTAEVLTAIVAETETETSGTEAETETTGTEVEIWAEEEVMTGTSIGAEMETVLEVKAEIEMVECLREMIAMTGTEEITAENALIAVVALEKEVDVISTIVEIMIIIVAMAEIITIALVMEIDLGKTKGMKSAPVKAMKDLTRDHLIARMMVTRWPGTTPGTTIGTKSPRSLTKINLVLASKKETANTGILANILIKVVTAVGFAHTHRVMMHVAYFMEVDY
jgi:hypothetical protein